MPVDAGVAEDGTLAVVGCGIARRYTKKDVLEGVPRRRDHRRSCEHPIGQWVRRRRWLNRVLKHAPSRKELEAQAKHNKELLQRYRAGLIADRANTRALATTSTDGANGQ